MFGCFLTERLRQHSSTQPTDLINYCCRFLPHPTSPYKGEEQILELICWLFTIYDPLSTKLRFVVGFEIEEMNIWFD